MTSAGSADIPSTARPCPYCGAAVIGPHSGCTGLFRDVMSLPEESAIDEIPPEAQAFENDETRLLADYILVEQIGKGGMGTVWKAWDRKLTRWVAIKFLNGQDRDDYARFAREAKLAARLRHPNIAAVFDTGEVPSKQAGQEAVRYLAMEYIEGQSVSVAQLPIERWLEIFARVARAVDHAHQQGVVHRDLKPSNLMLTRDSWPYVMDFGLAKSIKAGSSVSISGVILGTPAFMPPEQAAGKTRETDPRSDVYSLGATLYYVLTRQEPFRAEESVDVIIQVLKKELTPPRAINPDIPREIEAVILKAMSRDKEQRYASAAAMADDLEHLIAREPLSAAAPARKGVIGVLVAFMAASVMLSTFLLLHKPPVPPPPPGPAPVVPPPPSPLPRFVSRFRDLKENRRWKEARTWIDQEGRFLSDAERRDYAREIDDGCREQIRKSTAALASGAVADRLENRPPDFHFESLSSELPPRDQLLLPDPVYDWTLRLLGRIDAGQAPELIRAAADAVAFENSGENPWFIAAEQAARRALLRELGTLSQKAHGASREVVLACRSAAQTLTEPWDALLSGLPAGFRNRHAALLDQHDRELRRAREDFPVDPPFLGALDISKLLNAPDAESRLEDAEQKLRALREGNLTRESQQSLLVRLVTVRALVGSFQGAMAEQIAGGLAEIAPSLKLLGVPPEERSLFGPKVAAVFDRLLR